MAASDVGFQDVLLLMPAALRERAEQMAARESLSLNLFILMAIAEKLQSLQLEHCLGVRERDEPPSAGSPFSNPLIH